MSKKIRILFLSANPWTTSRILVDEEAREIFEKLQEGSDRDRFELQRHAATRPVDLQRLLMMHEPHIVHFSGHGSKKQKIILGGKPGRGKQVDRDGLAQVFALYKSHVRLVVLNACFTTTQARSISEVIDYSVGAGKGIGDKEGVAFAGAFYRALGFGKSVRAAFESAKAELALTRMPRTKGLGLFVRKGVNENDSFPKVEVELDNEAGNPGRHVSESFINPSTHYDMVQDESALHQKKRERVGARVTVLKTFAASASELIYKECPGCENNQGQNLSMRTQVDARTPTLGFVRRGELSDSASINLQKAKPAKRTKAHATQHEVEGRTSVGASRAYVTFTLRVFKVALSSSKRLSQTRAAGKDQAAGTRARRGIKQP